MKDNSVINEIIIKVITGEELTSTESTMYEEYIANEEHRKSVEEWKAPEFQHQKLKEYHNIDVESPWAVIDQRVNYGKQVEIKKPRNLFRDVATSAAAVLFILAAAYLLWWYGKRENATPVKENVKTIAKQDIGPAQTTALLTLADGSKMMLDSTEAGQLAQQGGAVIVNENGTLKYQGKAADQQEVLFNTLTTAYAQKYAVVLADGSKVWLNAGASIRYPVEFTGNERKVEITGEVYFEVTHNSNKPFIVHVSRQQGPGMDVQVVGTHFNINAYDDEAAIKTTLLEGSVKVVCPQSAAGNKSVILKPGQQAIVSQTSQPISVQTVNTDAVVAWKNGIFNFENADMDVVMRQLTKWYDIDVVYEGAKPAEKISGEMQRTLTLSQVAENLEFMNGLRFRIEGRKLIVPAATPDSSHKKKDKQPT